jgi:hypothetical protein
MPPIIGRSTEGRDIRREKIYIVYKKKFGIDRKCNWCGRDMHTTKAHVARGSGKFCSKACSIEANRKQTEVFCKVCGFDFWRGSAEIARRKGEGIFCSQECFKVHKRKHARSYPKIGARHAHRVIAEQVLGRKLRRKEIVHHKDRNKLNYDPSNLEVLKNRREHAKEHAAEIGARVAESNRRRAKKK